jgi:hypothetical protein
LLVTQEAFTRDEADLATIEAEISSLEALTARRYEEATGTRLPPMPLTDMTGHVMQALERGSKSNWRARNIFKRVQWRRHLREIWLMLRGHRN